LTITYPSNNHSECTSSYTDTFNYKVVDSEDAESTVSAVFVSVAALNCSPVISTFTQKISETSAINFADNVSDLETTNAFLTIKLKNLPAKGVLTVNGSIAVIDTAYGVNTITYAPKEKYCGSSHSDSFQYIAVDSDTAESTIGTVNITAEKCPKTEDPTSTKKHSIARAFKDNWKITTIIVMVILNFIITWIIFYF